MSEVIKLRRGFNIKLKGEAEYKTEILETPEFVAIKPTDFYGLTPKLIVKPGDFVKTGDALFFDKYHPEVKFTAPLGGKIHTVKRGERRRILEVVVESDKDSGSVEFTKADPLSLTGEEIKSNLLKSGLWPFLKRRPYGIIADPGEKPQAVFVSTFDTAPLAPDYNYVMKDQLKTFQTGVNALSKLTTGSVFLGVNSDAVFTKTENAEIRHFSGPHPAGNPGIQIHHIAPLSRASVVWTINVQDVLFIGRLFETGRVDLTKTVVLSGSEVENPGYYKTVAGVQISCLTEGNLKKADHKQRIISGNVLTGTSVNEESYLGFFDSQITVIPEGDDYELLGWASPGFDKFSASKTYLSKLFPKKSYEINANMHGGERAFVLTGQYEKVVPMDILPVFLLKAIVADDIDNMEQLGIYEVIEEDFALCEYVCASKIKVQEILRKGINTMIKELG
ncbi:MAG: Na(+)-translocating NADH-quinone reductase subunit A [Bacteroidales bacterium]|jgi:Na+-transporting NADH:ubiquinone oxidoreductase subunit A|nr:Na(+)-translocating NADH-quinone reductase subunit A [Bacteroidales bacterium]